MKLTKQTMVILFLYFTLLVIYLDQIDNAQSHYLATHFRERMRQTLQLKYILRTLMQFKLNWKLMNSSASKSRTYFFFFKHTRLWDRYRSHVYDCLNY